MPFFKKHSQAIVSAAALALFLVLVAASSSADAIPTASWGLSFQKEGAAPVGNAAQDALAVYDAAYVGSADEPVIYLTFDAGYENGYMPQILDVLKAHNAPAAFFVVGSYIEQNPELIKRMAEEGHIVGNHTMHHYDMSKIADEKTFRQELADVEARYEEVVGAPMPKFYRPPQGVFSKDNLKMAQALGYKTVFWSLAYVDWLQDQQPTSEQAFAKLLPRIHNGAVVLLHSTSATNAAILDELLTRWETMGYRFEPLENLFAAGNGN
ncbi:MAG: polysaccharide deacetylase family protein [Oscillospiraceae bacterium]|nr:polysaccharide deacetylase family protein [Oscillospiraceae bacterium]